MSDLLFEIGCENLPPAAIEPAARALAREARQRLESSRLRFGDVYATGAPRRLVLIVRDLAEVQAAETETVTGPPASRAYDAAGKPTQAAIGFARSHGLDAGKLRVVDTERGPYVAVVRRLKRRRASSLLKTLLPECIGALKFPKEMRWEASGLRFGRPIRWVVCLLGGSVVPFEVAGVKSGNVTYTTPWIRRQRIRVRNADHYLAALERNGIIVDHADRAQRIRTLAQRTADRLGMQLVDDEGLVRELTFMLEEPRPLVGEFDRQYLVLPPEVVTTAMRAHQRYFAFTGRGRKLMPKFLTFTEGRVGSPAAVRRGNEKVLRARLEDALFYWHEDTKVSVDGLAERLASIVFIEGLGTLAQKSERIAVIAEALVAAGACQEKVDPSLVARAAHIAKADLASEMIKDGKEFTLLQGLIGSYYAAEAGEAREVVAAVREQYAPRAPDDPLPETETGAVIGMADRIDTICGCFLAGLVPTGSQDPYALRRQANGLLRMLERRASVSLEPLLELGVGAYREAGLGPNNADGSDVLGQLKDFFRNRVEQFLKDRGIDYDVVNAVSAIAWSTPAAALVRARAMQSVRGELGFDLLVTGAKRVGNILDADLKSFSASWEEIEGMFQRSGEKGRKRSFDKELFDDPAEHELLTGILDAIPVMKRAEGAGDMEAVFSALAALGPTIDAYFDRVLVNCPDERLRRNRHHFLAAVLALFSKYADFSRIVEGGTPRVGASGA